MYNIARLALLDRKALFDTYSFRFGTVREIVEKDFWVTLMLDYLFHRSEFKDIFTFKGGTSLSKCFHIIDRFSEDIDLILDGFPPHTRDFNRELGGNGCFSRIPMV